MQEGRVDKFADGDEEDKPDSSPTINCYSHILWNKHAEYTANSTGQFADV